MTHKDLRKNINLIMGDIELDKIPLDKTILVLNSPAFWIKESLPEIDKEQFIIFMREADLIIRDTKAK